MPYRTILVAVQRVGIENGSYRYRATALIPDFDRTDRVILDVTNPNYLAQDITYQYAATIQ